MAVGSNAVKRVGIVALNSDRDHEYFHAAPWIGLLPAE
jgi:hypothetical protein